MSILKVARMGHPVLRQKAAPVPPGEIKSARIQRLIDDLFETMAEYSGIGLAAPQVHESVRIFVAGLRRTDQPPTDLSADTDMPSIVVINPELTMTGETIEQGWEGCLSIPDVRGLVPRASEITVDAYDRKGRRVQFTARGLPARVIQHETDHLDGVLFFDRMRSLETLTFMDEYHRYWTKHEGDEE
jgi:peptide deformylase